MKSTFTKIATVATLLAALATAATMSLTSADPTAGATPVKGGGIDNSGGNTTCVVMGASPCLAAFNATLFDAFGKSDALGKRLTVNEVNKIPNDAQVVVCLPGTGMGTTLKGNQVDGRANLTFSVLAACAGI